MAGWNTADKKVKNGVTIISLCCTVSAAFLYRAGSHDLMISTHWNAQFSALLALYGLLGLLFGLAHTIRTTTVLLLARFVMLAVLCYPEGANLSVQFALSVGLYVEVAYGCRPRLSIPLLAVANIFLLLYHRPMAAWNGRIEQPTLESSLFFLFWAVVLSAAAIWVNQLLRSYFSARRRIERLESSIHRLADVNIGFQRLTLTERRRSSQLERERITRNIHDTIGHLLITVNMMTQQALVMSGETNERLRELLERIQGVVRDGISDIRRTLYLLREVQQQEPSLAASLHELVNNFQEITGIRVRVSYANIQSTEMSREAEEVLFRLIQEGMTNAFKHGKATSIEIALFCDGEGVHLSVRDNGVGSWAGKKGIGLVGMEERVGALNGTVRAGNGPSGGFDVRAYIPLWKGGENGSSEDSAGAR